MSLRRSCISPYFRRGGGNNPYVADFITRVNSEGGSLTGTEIGYLNTFANSIDLSEFDRLWIHGLSNQVAARVSLVNSATADLITGVNSPIFTANQGISGNATTMYYDTNYNTFTDSVKFTQNSNSFGVYSRTDIDGSMVDMGNSLGGSSNTVNIRFTNLFYTENNSAGFISSASASSLGLFVSQRVNNTNSKNFKNGVELSDSANASSTPPSANMYLLASNASGVAAGFSSRQLALSFIGSGAINQSTFYTAVQTLGTSLGWAV